MQNFKYIEGLVKGQGVKKNFQPSEMITLMFYLEIETQLLLEQAIKYMRKDGRSQLCVNDIEMASSHLGHSQFPLSPIPLNKRQPKKLLRPLEVADLCGFRLGCKIETGQLKGRCLYLHNQLVNIPQNYKIHKITNQELDNIKTSQYRPQSKGQFNIIRQNEYLPLTDQQSFFFHQLEYILNNNLIKELKTIDGRCSELLYMYVEFIRKYSNETCIKMINILINHQSIPLVQLQFYLNHLFEALLLYRGAWALKAGQIIVDLVCQFRTQFPVLMKIMDKQSTDYSFIIKSVLFQEAFEVSCIKGQLEIFIENMIRDIFRGNRMAALCFKVILDKAQWFESLFHQKVNLPYWVPSPLLVNDPYMMI